MNLFDLGAVVLVVLGFSAGVRSGVFPQLGGLAGAIAGGAAAILVLPLVAEPLATLEPLARATAVLAGLVLAVGIGEGIGSGTGYAISRSIGRSPFGTADRAAGAVLGVVQAILVVWLAGSLIAEGPFPRLATLARESRALRELERVLPPPSAVAADLDRLIDASGLPDVIVGLEPLPNPAIELPSDPEVARIGRFAGPSTVQVASVACSARLSGTGFAVARDYVVTNAHVVAGASATRVRAGERTAEAVPVLFDPDLDVALLHVRGLELPPLVLATADPPRGAAGAVLGYPLGEGLTVVPAAVVRSIEALGRDIYDRAPVRRDVLELRARVERGDSGGPFVLPDGTVGGVIFAEARSDPSVGYALSPVEVATAIRPAIGRTREADTGPCLV